MYPVIHYADSIHRIFTDTCILSKIDETVGYKLHDSLL